MKKLFAALAALVMVLALASPVAGTSDKVTICHAAGRAGTTHYITLTISRNAVYKAQGGHFYENGTPRAGHEEDYLGPCKVEPTPSASSQPTPSPTLTPRPSATPTAQPTPTASPVPSPTPTASAGESTPPTPSASPTLTPTTTPTVTLPPTDTEGTVDTLAQVALTGLVVYLLLGIVGVVAFVILSYVFFKRMFR